MSNWLVGDSARISRAVINPVTGAPIDPPLVTFKIKNPSGVIVDYTYPGTVSKSAVGAYYYDVSLTEKGIWKYRCLTDAPYQAASQGEIAVSPSNI